MHYLQSRTRDLRHDLRRNREYSDLRKRSKANHMQTNMHLINAAASFIFVQRSTPVKHNCWSNTAPLFYQTWNHQVLLSPAQRERFGFSSFEHQTGF